MLPHFFYGPDKVPFRLLPNGQVEAGLCLPFHGIVSRGLLNWLRSHNVPYTVWHEHAPCLETGEPRSDRDNPDVKLLRAAAAECKVLSFGQSAWCAQRFIELYGPENAQEADWCTLWNIKEGHTSSVWKVTYPDPNQQETSFVLNVARDQQAADELRLTSERMQMIADSDSSVSMAQVYDIRTIILAIQGDSYEVVVTRNEWIDNALEIHSRENRLTGDEELILVERFLAQLGHPAALTAIRGRIFTPSETERIRQGIAGFLNQAGAYLPEKPEININEGDAVWDGDTVKIVALSSTLHTDGLIHATRSEQ